jgi:excisionase family DNA binding protein
MRMSLRHTIIAISPRTTLTVEEAARVLGIGRSTAYEAVRCGQIPAMRLGRRAIVPTAWLAQQLGVTVEAVSTAAGHSEQLSDKPVHFVQ